LQLAHYAVIVPVREPKERFIVVQRETPVVAEANHLGQDQAARFGSLVRERRKALRMTQDDLALATGVGRRFIIDLEAGKPTCELGRSLLVANAVGLRVFDLIREDNSNNPLLPDMPEDEGPLS
jgi:DNA-binding XRE family transcriptional regulator